MRTFIRICLIAFATLFLATSSAVALFVQGTTGTQGTAATSLTFTAFSAGVGNGHCVWGVVTVGSTSAITITGTVGGVAVNMLASTLDTTNNEFSQTFILGNISGTPTSVVLNFSASVVSAGIAIEESGCLAAANPVDVQNGALTAALTTNPASPSVTTTVANDIIVGAILNDGGTTAPTAGTSPNAFTLRNTVLWNGALPMATEDGVVLASPGAVVANWVDAQAQTYSAFVIAIKPIAVVSNSSTTPAVGVDGISTGISIGRDIIGEGVFNPISFNTGSGAAPEKPGVSAALYNAPFYTCVRNFYVATTGNDGNPGTAAQPWLTIHNADTSSRQPGDCINVGAGTYSTAGDNYTFGGNAPTSTGYVVYRCQTLNGCHVSASTQQTSTGSALWSFAYTNIAQTLTAATAAGSNVLTFGSSGVLSLVNAGIQLGAPAFDLTNFANLPSPGTYVTAIGSTTITLNNNATGTGLANGDNMSFGGGPNLNRGIFFVVDGFEVDGRTLTLNPGPAACFATDDATFGEGNSAHHIWFLNNKIHDCGLAGISMSDKEWWYAIHNEIYNNSVHSTQGVQGSGLAYVAPRCIEPGFTSNCYPQSNYTTSGMDLTVAGYTPYHLADNWNYVHDNQILSTAGTQYGGGGTYCGNHTDGNGIIMDTFASGPGNTIPYPMQGLMIGNLIVHNGARGLHMFLAGFFDLINNTAWGNVIDQCLPVAIGNNQPAPTQNAFADLNNLGPTNSWWNNIGVSVSTALVGVCGPNTCGDGQGPVQISDTNCTTSPQNVCKSDHAHFFDTITNGGLGTANYSTGTDIQYGASNLQSTDPKFVTPGSNWALQAGSPALNYRNAGTPSIAPSWMVDAGACHHSFATCP